MGIVDRIGSLAGRFIKSAGKAPKNVEKVAEARVFTYILFALVRKWGTFFNPFLWPSKPKFPL